MRRKPKPGTKPVLRTVARQSRIRLASAQMARISLIFGTPMATKLSGLLGKLPDLSLSHSKNRGPPLREGSSALVDAGEPPVSPECINGLRTDTPPHWEEHGDAVL